MNILDIDTKSVSENLDILEDEIKIFLKKYGDNKEITPPSIKKYDFKLANTKTSKQVSETKGKKLVQGGILVIISCILSLSILTGQGDKKNIILPLFLGIGGGALIYKSYTEKLDYNNSRQAEIARRAKKDNEEARKTYFIKILTEIQKDAEDYRQFLSLHPTAGEIVEYREKNCLQIEEKEIFNLVLQQWQKEIQRKQEAKEAIKTIDSVVRIGLRAVQISKLDEIENELNEIGTTLTELGQDQEE